MENNPAKPIKTLIIEDSELDALLLVEHLKAGGYEPKPHRVDNADDLRDALREQDWDIVFSDHNMPQFSSQAALEMVRSTLDDTPFILVSGSIVEEEAVEAMNSGAQDYLLKGNMVRLVAAVDRELREVQERRGRRIATSERRRAEEALKDSESRLNLALKVARMGHWRYVCDTRRVEWYSGHEELYGIAADAFGGTWDAFLEWVHPDDRRGVDDAMGNAIAGDVPFDHVYRVVHPDGSVRWLHAFGNLYRGSVGHSDYVFGVTQDVTRRRAAEEEKEQLEAQLIQAQKMDAVGRLAGGVAHDFNNMLGVILGNAELALESLGPDDELYPELQEILKAAERSADLTRQLLAFARKQTIEPRLLDLNETVGGMLKMVRRLIGTNIDLKWTPGEVVGQIKIDPSQLDQILVNLCVNARDAIGDSGSLLIATEEVEIDQDRSEAIAGAIPGRFVRLAVTDNGCGMSSETLSHIFEPFFTTKGVGQGTGLGLATVFGVVKQNGGFIDVESELGVGTTFYVYLPRDESESAAVAKPKETKPPPRGTETILLVEDEIAILNLVRVLLERQGYTVLSATSPGEALRIAGSYGGTIELLVSDMIMPEMNGRDLADQLLQSHPHLKRLFMSGHTADVLTVKGSLPEGVHFIHKPFTAKEFAEVVREAIAGKKENP
jgi:PAS domain S-box-containing protein